MRPLIQDVCREKLLCWLRRLTLGEKGVVITRQTVFSYAFSGTQEGRGRARGGGVATA